MNKKITLAIIALSLLLSACTKTVAGHSVTVTMPHNDCGVAACTTDTTTQIIKVK